MTSVRGAVGVLAAALLGGCIHDDRPQRDRGAAGLIENTQTIKAPEKDRCAGTRGSGAGKRCEEARYLAEIYVRKLDVGTDVCLEGGFGDEPGGACLARGGVVDTRTNEVLLEIRGAKPDSRWFKKEQNQYWFEEGALVDLYLADHGY
jgi:hypothetical protein